MQVKKFEARSMKEALEMVKSQMGPDAIILSARDNVKSYGLLGQGSVEITAAIREDLNHKKKFAESRMREQDRERFQQSSAQAQKKIINKYVDSYMNKTAAANASTASSVSTANTNSHAGTGIRPRKGAMKYIDIEDDQINTNNSKSSPDPKVHNEAQSLWQKMNPREEEIQNLKQEINILKEMLEKFSTGSQQTMNTSYPGLSYGIPYELSFLFTKLTNSGVSEEVSSEILNLAKDLLQPSRLKQKSIVEGWVARYILETTPIASQKLESQVQCFVGPVGSGKTSTLVKMASHLMVRENKKIAIVTTDTQKVGSVEQMKIYSHILNIPFAVVKDPSEWGKILRQLSYADYILCDFPSVNFKNHSEVMYLKNLIPEPLVKPQVHMVLSTLMGDQDLEIIGKNLKNISAHDVLFTGLDQSSQHGSIYNFTKKFGIGLYGFGIGTKIPEDFEYATKERVLDLIFRITASTNNPMAHFEEGASST
ncbi:MAG TPA: flagellar biosynthesis protein FlhF [Pseudobdellovibrionaceae bacterium]|nr:flagellar biosynthesis protein FlhF [Pseudobdellovibrionaceae bacterium]